MRRGAAHCNCNRLSIMFSHAVRTLHFRPSTKNGQNKGRKLIPAQSERGATEGGGGGDKWAAATWLNGQSFPPRLASTSLFGPEVCADIHYHNSQQLKTFMWLLLTATPHAPLLLTLLQLCVCVLVCVCWIICGGMQKGIIRKLENLLQLF